MTNKSLMTVSQYVKGPEHVPKGQQRALNVAWDPRGTGGPSPSAAVIQLGNGVFGRVFIEISSETLQQLRPIGHSTRSKVDRLLGTHSNEEIDEKDEKSAN